MSLGRVRYDNFVMQRGWCLAHRLVASKFTPPTIMGASQNYHTARGVLIQCDVRRTPQTSVRPQTADLRPQTLDRRHRAVNLGPQTFDRHHRT